MDNEIIVDEDYQIEFPDYLANKLGFSKGQPIILEDTYDSHNDVNGFTSFITFH